MRRPAEIRQGETRWVSNIYPGGRPPEPVDGWDVEPEGKGMSCPSGCITFR